MATYNENASLTTRRYGCKATTHEAVARGGRVADREVRVERGAVCGRPGDEALEGGLWHQVGGLCSKFGPRGAGQGACAPPIEAEALPRSRLISLLMARAFYCERLYRRRCDDRGEVRRRLSARNLRASPFERAPPRLAPHSGPKSVPLEPNAILARHPQRRRTHRSIKASSSGCWHRARAQFRVHNPSRSYKENASLTTRRYGRPLAACLTA